MSVTHELRYRLPCIMVTTSLSLLWSLYHGILVTNLCAVNFHYPLGPNLINN